MIHNLIFLDFPEYVFPIIISLLLSVFTQQLPNSYQACAAYLIRIASSNQVQRQQRRDEPVRENTHLMLNTLASRLRSYHSIVGVESLVFWVIRTQLIYIQSTVCTSG